MDINERLNEIAKEEAKLNREKQQLLAEQAQKPLLEKLAEFQVLKQKMTDELRAQFPSFILPLMLKSDNIKSIGFAAYTPYFNDGDECIYRVETSYPYVNGEYGDDVELSDDDRKLIKEICTILEKIPDQTYRDVFGDHVMITVNIDGTMSVKEYEHE